MTNLKNLILGAASLAGIFAAAPAFADDAPSWSLAGTIDVQSDYKFRGISQNDRTPSPQGTLNLSGPNGFYVGTWASTVDFDPTKSGNPYVEVDIYAGKHTDVWGVDWNIEPYYYSYPASKYGTLPGADYFELINQFTKAFGPITAQATWAWSPDLGFEGGTGNYLAGNLAYTITDWLSISGNVGHQWAQNAKNVPVAAGGPSRDYTYGDIGLTATWKMFSLDVRYSGTDLGSRQCGAFYMATNNACAGDVVATLNYNFALYP